MPNVDVTHKRDLSLFRKIAIGTWQTAYDPTVYGSMELDMEAALAYIDAFRERTGRKLTVTHLMARAMGQVLHDHPDANALLRFNRLYLRRRVAVFIQVAMMDEATGRADLSGLTIYDVHQKSLVEIVEEVEARSRQVRQRRDPNLERTRGILGRVPGLLLNRVLRAVSFLAYDLNLDLRWAGMPRDPFGGVMITNIGSLGLDVAYVPLIPYSRVPLLLALGAIQPVPSAREGELIVRRAMKVHATFDHRFLDGYHVALMSRTLRRWIESPEEHFGPVEGMERPLA